MQRRRPVAVMQAEGRRWWWFRDRFYWEDDDLAAGDVMALVAERERRTQRRLERAHAAMRQELADAPRRSPIPRDIRLAVWQRDGGRCCECGGDFELQYDHVIPFSLGGAATAENLQLLCAGCNRDKGASAHRPRTAQLLRLRRCAQIGSRRALSLAAVGSVLAR